MKKLITIVALAASVVSAPAFARTPARDAGAYLNAPSYTATGSLSCGSGGYCGYNGSEDPSAPASPDQQR